MRAKIEKYAGWIVWGLIPLTSLLMHLPILNRPLVGIHVWRQTQTQTNIRNFATEDGNLFNPRVDNLDEGGPGGIKRMEFPLMQWIFSLFYRLFGDHILISRLLSFLIGILSLGGIYTLFRWVFQDKMIAVLGTWAFCFSPAVYYYIVNPMPDNLGLCLGICGLALFYKWKRNPGNWTLWGSAALLGLATAVKLPFILLLAVPMGDVAFQLLKHKFKGGFKSLLPALHMGLMLIPALAWYAWVIPTWTGNGIVQGIGGEEQTDWGALFDIASYNFYSILPEVLLNYAAVPAFLAGFWFFFRQKGLRSSLFPPLALFAAGLLAYYFFEMNMIVKIHDYYLFPFLPLLFLIVAYGLQELLKLKGWFGKALVVAAIIVMPITAYLRMQQRWDLDKPGFNADLITHQDALRKAIPAEVKIVAGADASPHVWLYYLDRKGWAFQHWQLTSEWLDARIEKGATYIITDMPYPELQPEVQAYFGPMIAEEGEIRVYPLKTL